MSKFIAADALLLLGILFCKGSAKKRAQLLYDIIQPELEYKLSTQDADFKLAIVYLIDAATTFDSLYASITNGLEVAEFKNEGFHEKYEGKFEIILEKIFGEYANRVSRDEFIEGFEKMFKSCRLQSNVMSVFATERQSNCV